MVRCSRFSAGHGDDCLLSDGDGKRALWCNISVADDRFGALLWPTLIRARRSQMTTMKNSHPVRPFRYFRFVELRHIDAYLALGWHFDGSMPMHIPHGSYGVMLQWMYDSIVDDRPA